MKTKLQTVGCLLTALVVFSTSAFAGNPANNGIANNDNAATVAGTTVLVNPGTTSNVITAATTANAESNAILSDNTNNIDNTQAIASYHHGSSGSSGDGISGKNIICLGVGFISVTGIITSVWTAAGYSSSSIPPIVLSYERGINAHLGVGARMSYSSTSLSLGSQQGDPFYNNGVPYTYDNKVTYTGFMFVGTIAYHFGDNAKVDPYLMGALGYTSLSETFTTTDPNASVDGNVNLYTGSLGGFTFGGVFGCRFYFTDNIGAWVDFGYMGYGAALLNLGLVAKF